jgi:hypothetical protein
MHTSVEQLACAVAVTDDSAHRTVLFTLGHPVEMDGIDFLGSVESSFKAAI